jgi:hypothetical protein
MLRDNCYISNHFVTTPYAGYDITMLQLLLNNGLVPVVTVSLAFSTIIVFVSTATVIAMSAFVMSIPRLVCGYIYFIVLDYYALFLFAF